MPACAGSWATATRRPVAWIRILAKPLTADNASAARSTMPACGLRDRLGTLLWSSPACSWHSAQPRRRNSPRWPRQPPALCCSPSFSSGTSSDSCAPVLDEFPKLRAAALAVPGAMADGALRPDDQHPADPRATRRATQLAVFGRRSRGAGGSGHRGPRLGDSLAALPLGAVDGGGRCWSLPAPS